MLALSIRQPWSWLIVSGIKDVENRRWHTAFRGRIYVHAGKSFDQEGYEYLLRETGGLDLPLKVDYQLGALIGEVDIVDCKFRKAFAIAFSRWHEHGSWGFILANPVMYEQPIPCKGQLGLFEVNMPGALTEYAPEFRH